MSQTSAALAPFRLAAHAAAAPIRLVGRNRAPAVEHPKRLRPGDPPGTGGRLLVLYDGGCGICLHARDVFARWDGGRRIADDRIARHEHGLLADLSEDETYESFHVIHPDGRRESGGDGLAALFEALPGAGPIGRAMRRFPGSTETFYEWFANNRPWISQGSGLINHPQRDPDEQPDDAPGGDAA